MFLGRVIGTVWSTKKVPSLEGLRFLLIRPVDFGEAEGRDVVVAADTIGAGFGEAVIVAHGRAARLAVGNADLSIDAAIIGIVDRMEVEQSQAEAGDNGTLIRQRHRAGPL
ncbi:MAG: EutN/CcmL family microcompartment protein [Acidobacteria bacterium]|nr:EutN/CcmL family microcompartment protein [Acidobacteriota bacterium]